MADTDIIIVGAGPVGLWTAIQLKLNNPSLNITIFEKHQIYKRSHVLIIDYKTLKNFDYNKSDEAATQFFDNLFEELISKGKTKNTPIIGEQLLIRTNELEEVLKNTASALGIKIDYKGIDNVQELQQKFPEAKIIIGADGAHSIVRREVFGTSFDMNTGMSSIVWQKHVDDEGFSYKKDLQYVVQFKYEANNELGKSDNLSLTQLMYAISKSNFLLSEQIGKPNQNGHTPITLQLFVDKETYEALGEASFAKPKLPSDPNLPIDIVHDLSLYLNIRQKFLNETYNSNSGKITKLPLSIYRSSKFAIEQEEIQYFLIGDAAFAVPYFRALNDGLLCGSKFSELFTQKKLENYDHYVSKLFTKEASMAFTKNLGVSSLASTMSSNVAMASVKSVKLGMNRDTQDIEKIHPIFTNFQNLAREKEGKCSII
jgi:hypothetical protein